jgi:hypothetical protein
LGINTCIWGNFENFIPKTLHAVHMSYFSSKNTEMTNTVLTLKILKTLLGVHWNFLNIRGISEKVANFGVKIYFFSK